MADDFKVQVNLKLGETLINVRGQEVAEVLEKVEEIKAGLDALGEVMSVAKQVTMAKGLTGFTPAPPASNNTQNSSAATGTTAGNLRCKHGAFKDFKGKTKKNGDAYQYRYYCPAPFGAADSCKPASLPGQEAWSA